MMTEKIYAHIIAGAVWEIIQTAADITTLYHPALVWIDITALAPQPQVGWSFNGQTFSPPPPPPPPTPAQLACAAVAAGCQIVSTAAPALNGTYACDPASQSKIMATALYIQVNGKFPAKQPALPWADITGTPRLFTTTSAFLAFSTAIGDYVAQLDLVIGGATTTMPAQPEVIP